MIPERSLEVWTAGKVLAGRFRALRNFKKGYGVETWLGEDLAHSDQVVVKIVSEQVVPKSVQCRLEHEASVLQRLSSPCLPPLVDVGRSNGFLYVVMPFLRGVTL